MAVEEKSGRILVLGVSGDGGLGKTALAGEVVANLGDAVVLGTDGFVMERHNRRKSGGLSGDDPRAIDLESMLSLLKTITTKQAVTAIPVYDHSSGTIIWRTWPKDFLPRYVVLEGAYALHHKVRSCLDIAVFLSADESTRFMLRREVDILERGYSPAEFALNWKEYRRLYEEVVHPVAAFANVEVAVDSERSFIAGFLWECDCPIMGQGMRG